MGDDFLSFPTFFSLLQRKHLLRAGMALLKIIKETVWREKVNKVIHASSAEDTKVRQRNHGLCCVQRDSHESAPTASVPPHAAAAAGLAVSWVGGPVCCSS